MTTTVSALAFRPDIKLTLASLKQHRNQIVTLTNEIQSIPAPTFHEQQRAMFVQQHFETTSLDDISIDSVGNVYARLPGLDTNLPSVMVSAHLDTVFPFETDLKINGNRHTSRIRGPGIGDNSLGLAALLILPRILTEAQITPKSDIWFVATVGEEGLGDLRGMRAACDHLAGKIGQAIILEGIGLGRVYAAGLGVRRLRITVEGQGGHSWLHQGRPSAIHQIMRLGTELVDQVQPPDNPQSSLNIGLITGGTSINTVAAQASCAIDLRSIDATTLRDLETQVREIVSRYDKGDISIDIAVIGDRPAASLAPQHPLVQATIQALSFVDCAPATVEPASTDANIPLSREIPSVCICITTGADAHTTREYIDIEPITQGMRQLLILTMSATEHADHWSDWTARI